MFRSLVLAIVVAMAAGPVTARGEESSSASHSKKKRHHHTQEGETEAASEQEAPAPATPPSSTAQSGAAEVPMALADPPPPAKPAPTTPAVAPAPEAPKPASATSPEPSRRAAAPAPSGPRFWLQPVLAGGLMSDQDTPELSDLLRFGLSGEVQPSRSLPLSVSADFAFSFYRTSYLMEGFTGGGGLNAVATSEQRYDAGAGAGYTFTLAHGRVELIPRLAVRLSVIHNDLNPWNLGGVAPEGVVRVHLDDAFAVEAHGNYTYNLFFAHPAEQAVLGRPLALSTFGAGISYHLPAARSDVSLGWTGEVLTREHSNRFYNLVAVGMRRELP